MNQKNNKLKEFLDICESYIDNCDTNNLKNISLFYEIINIYIDN